ncbi:MAG TPA: Mur ligase family protein [Thermomicrobiaceae bacterium]|nr:Mur ligase family protein [Thermomicrobiaceae bacterium]
MGARQTVLERYHWAADYVNSLIQAPPSPPASATAEEIRARQGTRLARLRRFLAYIGDPQERYRTVHVTGTSGKGSTAAFIAGILSEGGYHTGLHVSPYLQVETEKLVIDGRLLAGDRFAGYVAELAEAARRWEARGGERVTYGEFWVALTFLAFAGERLDWAVIEVGAGGRFDLTNVINSEVAVITSVGFDHVRTLGPGIPDIAWHKAGIIKPGKPAVTTVADPAALEVIRREATEQGSPLVELAPGRDYTFLAGDAHGTLLREARSGREFVAPLPGSFQAANAAAAIGAVRALGLPALDDDVSARGLAATRFPGRIEVVQERPQVVLDGAHNPDKMRSLAANAGLLGSPRRRVLVLGALDGHDYLQNARIIAPLCDVVVLTAPHTIERATASTEALGEVMRELGKPVETVLEPREAIEVALRQAGPEDQVLVTGSLYLVGQVRERWYPSDDIVWQQTSWPVALTP